MILWIATKATPQFAPILNRLCLEYGLDIHAYYMQEGSGMQGWGDLAIVHPNGYHSPRGFVRDFIAGFRASRRPGLGAVVVFGYSTPYAMGLLLGSRVTGIPVFTQSDSDYKQYQTRQLKQKFLKSILLRILYSPRTRVWVIAPGNADYWRSFGLSNQGFVDFESPIPEQESTHEVAQTQSADAVVLYVGRLSSEKRVDDAVAAVNHLRGGGMKVRLRIVGEGAFTKDGFTPVEPPDWVDLVGAVPHNELGREYLGADVLALPSERDAYGLVVREALQFGLPVVCSSVIPAARMLCDRGWNLVEPRDYIGLAGALFKALDAGVRWTPKPPIDTTQFYYDELRGVNIGEALGT